MESAGSVETLVHIYQIKSITFQKSLISMLTTERVAIMVRLLAPIRKELRSNLGGATRLIESFHGLPQDLQSNIGVANSLRPVIYNLSFTNHPTIRPCTP
jgi:hypothetical protein